MLGHFERRIQLTWGQQRRTALPTSHRRYRTYWRYLPFFGIPWGQEWIRMPSLTPYPLSMHCFCHLIKVSVKKNTHTHLTVPLSGWRIWFFFSCYGGLLQCAMPHKSKINTTPRSQVAPRCWVTWLFHKFPCGLLSVIAFSTLGYFNCRFPLISPKIIELELGV